VSGLVLLEARHEIYVDYHHRIVEAVETCLPVTAVLSIDEMACRLMGGNGACWRRWSWAAGEGAHTGDSGRDAAEFCGLATIATWPRWPATWRSRTGWWRCRSTYCRALRQLTRGSAGNRRADGEAAERAGHQEHGRSAGAGLRKGGSALGIGVGERLCTGSRAKTST